MAAGLLAGCNNSDNTVKNVAPVTATAQSSKPFSLQNEDRSKIPPQFAQQYPGSNSHGSGPKQ